MLDGVGVSIERIGGRRRRRVLVTDIAIHKSTNTKQETYVSFSASFGLEFDIEAKSCGVRVHSLL